MIKFNESLDGISNYITSETPVYLAKAFQAPENALKEFYQLLFNPLNGSHKSFTSGHTLVKVMNHTQMLHPNIYAHQFHGDQGYYRDTHAIKKAIEQKCSIVFDEYYRYSKTAKELTKLIQAYFNCNSGCNAYLSQQGGIAFPIHRDTHHVLVFSIAGKKKWTVYNTKQQSRLAYAKEPGEESDEIIKSSGHIMEQICEPGSLLYIPIGQYHSVENLSNNALHLTVSMSFKPQISVLNTIYNALYDTQYNHCFSEKTRAFLNSTNFTFNKKTDPKAVTTILQGIQLATKELIKQPEFMDKLNTKKQNKHLLAFSEISDEIIQEMVDCSK